MKKPPKIFGGFIFLLYICSVKQKQNITIDNMSKVTTFDIGLYKAIHQGIDNLVKKYYRKFIYCKWQVYHLNGWELTDDDKIRIIYSYIDYHDEPCCEDRVLTLDEIYEDLEE